MVVLQPDGFARELVQVRRLDDGISGESQVPIALVVGNDQDDIGRVICSGSQDPEGADTNQGKEKPCHRLE